MIQMDSSDGDFCSSGRLHRIEIAADRNRPAAVKTSIPLAIGGDKALAAATVRGGEAESPEGGQRSACWWRRMWGLYRNCSSNCHMDIGYES